MMICMVPLRHSLNCMVWLSNFTLAFGYLPLNSSWLSSVPERNVCNLSKSDFVRNKFSSVNKNKHEQVNTFLLSYGIDFTPLYLIQKYEEDSVRVSFSLWFKVSIEIFCSSPTSVYVASTKVSANSVLDFTERSLCDLGCSAQLTMLMLFIQN